MKIIDSHLHIGRLNEKVYLENKLKILQTELVYGFVSSVSAGTVSQGYGNKDNFRFCRSTKCFKGLIWINPYEVKWEQDAKRHAKEAVGIKLHPVIDRWHLKFDFIKPVLDFALREKLPIFAHTDSARCQSWWYKEMAKYLKNLPLILYHSEPYLQAIKLTKTYKNVYLETSAKQNLEKLLAKACRDGLEKKILFGSDMMFPEDSDDATNLHRFELVVKKVKKLIPVEKHNLIFYSNAKKIIDKYGKRNTLRPLRDLILSKISGKTA